MAEEQKDEGCRLPAARAVVIEGGWDGIGKGSACYASSAKYEYSRNYGSENSSIPATYFDIKPLTVIRSPILTRAIASY